MCSNNYFEGTLDSELIGSHSIIKKETGNEFPNELKSRISKYVRSVSEIRDSMDRSKNLQIVDFPKKLKVYNNNEDTSFESSVKNDFIIEDEINKIKGDKAEELVYEYEMKKISHFNKKEFSGSVDWVAKHNDGCGYDIISYEIESGLYIEIFIEVKGTSSGPGSPFFISENELKIARKLGEKYRLYRVFNLGKEKPEFYIINGIEMMEKLKFVPTTYKVYKK